MDALARAARLLRQLQSDPGQGAFPNLADALKRLIEQQHPVEAVDILEQAVAALISAQNHEAARALLRGSMAGEATFEGPTPEERCGLYARVVRLSNTLAIGSVQYELADRWVALAERTFGLGSARLADPLLMRASIVREDGTDASRLDLERAISLLKLQRPRDFGRLRTCYMALGRLLESSGDKGHAIACYESAAELPSSTDPLEIFARKEVALAHAESGAYRPAIAELRKSIGLAELLHTRDSVVTTDLLLELVRILLDAGEEDEARSTLDELREAAERRWHSRFHERYVALTDRLSW